MRKTCAVVALALTIGAALVSLSIAQDRDEDGGSAGMMGGGCPMMGMMGGGMMGHGMMGQGGMWGGRDHMSAIIDGRLAYLKDELKMTDAQLAAWTSYADAVRGRVAVMLGMREGMMNAMQKGGAVERLEIRISGMEAMLEAMKAVKPAIESLYSSLSADQKKVADQLIGVDCGAM